LSSNAEIAESQHAYVKIEARILALLVREGITIVLFTAYIPAVAEPFGAGAFVGKRAFDDPASLGAARESCWIAVCESCCYTKVFATLLQWFRR
jgi:hypothetical protein